MGLMEVILEEAKEEALAESRAGGGRHMLRRFLPAKFPSLENMPEIGMTHNQAQTEQAIRAAAERN